MTIIQGIHKQSRTGVLVQYDVNYQLNGSIVEWRGNVTLPDGVLRPLTGGTLMDVAANKAESVVQGQIWREIDQTDWLASTQLGSAE